MKIYYDRHTLSWYQSTTEAPLSFGSNFQKLTVKAASDEDICFDLRQRHNRLGPIIGIITARKKNGSLGGNGRLFMELQQKLISLAGISFIFTLDDVHENYINAHIYSPERNKWFKARVPYPDIVYNRIPFRKIERDQMYQALISALRDKDIPFFNPSFINKYELYCVLNQSPFLQDHLPETILIGQKEKLDAFIQKHQNLYLKPLQSSQGKGILRISEGDAKNLNVEGLTISETYQSFEEFWDNWGDVFKEKAYLAQQEIKSAEYEGRRFDFRVLVHANHNSYVVTGIGIRQSQEQNITTHIPAGGRLIPYGVIKSEEHDEFFYKAANEIGKALTERVGYFGEFSIDAGIDDSGHYYIYEVNSKPMKFDETEIEQRKISQLCSLFLQLTKF
jgi:glutathione synthase/RimK-type ligase-like ATP-grasp enzyme